MFIPVSLGGWRSSRTRNSDEANGEFIIYNKGLFIQIFGLGYGVLGW